MNELVVEELKTHSPRRADGGGRFYSSMEARRRAIAANRERMDASQW